MIQAAEASRSRLVQLSGISFSGNSMEAKVGVNETWKNRVIGDILLPMEATIDTTQLAVFVAVVRAGSFTAAADALGTQKAHVSRVVTRLEKHLSVRLLQRSTRSLALTEVGRDLYERAAGILAALDETAAAVQGTLGAPQGVLRMTCGVEFGTLVVKQWIEKYLATYPKVRVDVEYTNRVTDLIHEGFDVGIRVGPLADSSLSARRLGELHYALYANPAYLRNHPEPTHPSELKKHELVMFSVSRPPIWRLVKGEDRFDIGGPARLVLDNNLMAADAAVAGVGVALLPRLVATKYAARGKLVEIMKGWSRASVPIHAVFASSRYLAPKVRAFIDLARANMPRT